MSLCDQGGFCAAIKLKDKPWKSTIRSQLYVGDLGSLPLQVRRIRLRTSFSSTKNSVTPRYWYGYTVTLNILIIRIHLLKHTGAGLGVEACRPMENTGRNCLLVFLFFFRWCFFRCWGLLLLLLTLFLGRFLFFTLSLFWGLSWFTPWGFIYIILNV